MKVVRITNGRIVDPANQRDEIADIWIAEGIIADASLSDRQKSEAEIIDAQDLIVSPGLIDMHVHLREPGQPQKETISTGSHAAAAGGFTSVVCMPNTNPVADNAGTITLIRERAQSECHRERVHDGRDHQRPRRRGIGSLRVNGWSWHRRNYG